LTATSDQPADIDIPLPHAGRIIEVCVSEDDMSDEGTLIARIEPD
jgi:pyruvate/2-oxoglutarate dehydrogenase complex dihydrolipoamide acyltransferase (E2) component